MINLLVELIEFLNVPPFCDENGDSTMNDLLDTVFHSQNFDWLMENKPKETRKIVEEIFRLKI